MISKDKITEIFCIADDFCKELEKEFAKKVLPDSDNAPKRHRKRMMSDAEVITILICFHFNSYRNFKHYYLYCVRTVWKDLFPKTFSYNRFIEIMPRCFVAMTMFLKLAVFGKCTGISFVDSTCIPVIHNKRFYSKCGLKAQWSTQPRASIATPWVSPCWSSRALKGQKHYNVL